MRMFYYLILVSMGCALQASDSLYVTQKTERIYRRYYIIKRLEAPVQTLERAALNRLINVDALKGYSFNNQHVNDIVKHMVDTHCISSFFMLWNDLCSYRYVDDSTFEDECITALYLLFNHETSSKMLSCDLSQEQKLNLLDKYLHLSKRASAQKRCPSSDDHEVSINHIARRFLILKRLRRPIHILINRCAYIQNAACPFIQHQEDLDALQVKQSFNKTIKQVQEQRTLEPLLTIYDDLRSFKHMQDDHFLQEILQTIFLIYKDLLLHDLHKQSEFVIMQEMAEVIDLSERLDLLSIDESLEAIDVATDKLIKIHELEQSNKRRLLHGAAPLAFGLIFALCMLMDITG